MNGIVNILGATGISGSMPTISGIGITNSSSVLGTINDCNLGQSLIITGNAFNHEFPSTPTPITIGNSFLSISTTGLIGSVSSILNDHKWGQLSNINEFNYAAPSISMITGNTLLSNPSLIQNNVSSFPKPIESSGTYSDLLATTTGFIKPDPSLLSSNSVSESALVLNQVEAIIDLFKLQVQDHNLWRIFWTKTHNTFVHVKAFSFQMMLYAISYSWLKSSNSSICIEQVLDESQQSIHLRFSYMGSELIVKILNRNHYPDLNELNLNNNTIYVLLNFERSAKTQPTNVTQICKPKTKIIEVDVSTDKFNYKGKSSKDLCMHELCVEFEGVEHIDDHYIQEKRKGGTNSYKNYKPLRDKVEEICKQELAKRQYRSALSLCYAVAKIIEKNHKDLLAKFAPYTQTERSGADWRQSTFYNWCKTVFKLATANCKASEGTDLTG